MSKEESPKAITTETSGEVSDSLTPTEPCPGSGTRTSTSITTAAKSEPGGPRPATRTTDSKEDVISTTGQVGAADTTAAEEKTQTEINRNIIGNAPLSPMHPPLIQHAYYYQHAPNSPATPSMGNGGYDVNIQSLLGQNSNNLLMRQQYPVIPPLSPHGNDANNGMGIGVAGGMEQDINLSMGTVPPASPLFPGAIPVFGSESLDGGRSMVAPTSPSLQYAVGPPPSPVMSYGAYPSGGYPSGLQPGSPEAPNSWNERTIQQQQMYPPTTPVPSPHIQSVQYQQSQTRRTASFDGQDLLPPSALEQDTGTNTYGTGATLFSQQQPWGYNTGIGPPTSPYNAPPPPVHHHGQMRSPGRGRQQGRGGGNEGQHMYYPATTPGPPIQTTHHNKGPEGANLFIFHIPNHFTNLNMWELFCRFGNLLSVRIMVEKDTGRSRGFGFVSYDSPDAAALAIKELNGFVIGNKRLKVQHKQIRGESGGHQQHDHSRPPPPFSESNGHGHSHTGQQHLPPQGDITAGHQANQAPAYTLTKKEVGLAVADANLPVRVSEKKTEQNNVDNTILNLDSIGEALPEVSK